MHVYQPDVAGVTFSDSDSAFVPKFLNPGPAILQIWESDSCSDSGCNRFFTKFWLPIRCQAKFLTSHHVCMTDWYYSWQIHW